MFIRNILKKNLKTNVRVPKMHRILINRKMVEEIIWNFFMTRQRLE